MGTLTSLPAKIAIAALMVGAAWTGGFFSGRMYEKSQQAASTVEAFQKREKVDADVHGRTDYQLCLSLGRMPDKCEQLRGLEKTPTGK